MGVAGILLLLLLAAFLLWFNNSSNSMQAMPSMIGSVYFDVEYRIGDCENAIDRVALTIDNIELWGTKWIVFPNAVYGSAANYAAQYGYPALFDKFDYTDPNSSVWDMYD